MDVYAYRFVLLLKLTGVLLYAGGLVASFVSTELAERRRAVHGIASPALLLVWLSGYYLASELQVPLTELWLLGGLVLSLSSQLALVYAVSRNMRGKGVLLAASLPLFATLALMVFRPTWRGLLS